jgi:hypothetical protein
VSFCIPPVVDLVEHGERGTDIDPAHPDACLCGRHADYLACPDAFQVGRMVIGLPWNECEPCDGEWGPLDSIRRSALEVRP